MPPVTRVARPPEKPSILFDGDCAFCRRWIARCRQTTGNRVDYTPYQSDLAAVQFPELPREQLATAVHLVELDGRVTYGAEAVFRSINPEPRWPLWLYENLPGFRRASEFVYRSVAANRGIFSLLTRLLWGASVEIPTHFVTRRIFLILLGLTYLIAFWSLQRQWPGLIGSRGIVPAAQVMMAMERNTQELGLDRYRLAPTLCWYGADDGTLGILCTAGLVLSALVILNIAPAPALFLLWLIYLSLAQVSTVFLGYQWDNLLLEVGFLAIFFAPLRLWPNAAREAPPPRIVLWLLRWLLFRLMFASGAVKLLSGDATWHDLTALTYHYETQPLPTPLAWFIHHLPAGFHRASCVVMFAIELLLPFCIFLPRRPRGLAFWGFTFLMVAIALTGNYTFFNLLTFALAITLLDDYSLVALARGKLGERVAAGLRPDWLRPWSVPLRWLRAGGLTLLTGVVLGVTSLQMVGLIAPRWTPDTSHPLVKLYEWVAPFRSINQYGLFAVMTTSRPEIIVEGSADGLTWLPYEFRHKPGSVNRRPTFVAPDQPRLDWQMWFAALGDVGGNPWFVNFCSRLLRGEREVIALMEQNPFPGRPPRYIRASLYDYHFTTSDERQKSGAWWQRRYKGAYMPAISSTTKLPE